LAEEQKEAPSSSEMRAFAYRLLGRREYSVFELGQRIRQKWPEADGVGDLVEALTEENLVSDQRYVESFVRSRIQRHQGPLKIRAALGAKGVDDSTIAGELVKYAGEWTALAREWLERQHTGPVDFDDRKKYYRRLKNRGFTHDQSMNALQ
jgi:regulatory protein